MADDLFGQGDHSVDPEKNYLEELVGEGKKFPSVEELARGKAESDAFIARIQDENKVMRAELEKRATVEDFLDRLKSEREQAGNAPPPNHGDDRTETQALTPEQVEALVAAEVEKRSASDSKSRNRETVRQTLERSFGPGYQQVLRQKADELGVGQEFLNNLAADQPKAFLALVGAESAPATRTPAQGTRDNPGGQSARKNYEYFKKTYGKRIDSYEVQQEMMRELEQQGTSFYS